MGAPGESAERPPLPTRLRLSNLLAAAWALLGVCLVRARARRRGVGARVPAPPPLPESAIAGVLGALRRARANCLSRSLVLQAWERAHGRERELVIGVTGPRAFRAHAWLEPELAGATRGEASAEAGVPAREFVEIHRPAPGR